MKINHTQALWVDVQKQSNFTVAGVVPSNTSIQLHKGWNLVGFPSFNDTYAVSDLKAEVGVETIEGFEASTPPYFLRRLIDAEFLQTGYGYWIKSAVESTWVVKNV